MVPLTSSAARRARLLVATALVAAILSALYPVLERLAPSMKQTVLASDKMTLPQIDRQAPKQVATATFALG